MMYPCPWCGKNYRAGEIRGHMVGCRREAMGRGELPKDRGKAGTIGRSTAKRPESTTQREFELAPPDWEMT